MNQDYELLERIILAKRSSMFLRHSIASPELLKELVQILLTQIVEPLDNARATNGQLTLF